MKRLVHVMIAMLVISGATYAAGPVGFGLQATGANINVPEPLKSVYGFGFGGGAHLDINLPLILAIRVQGDFITFSPDKAKYQSAIAAQAAQLGFQINPADLSIDGGRINILSATANAKVSPIPLPLISPYATGGIGIASISTSDVTVKYQSNTNTIPGGSAQTKFSANLGAGVDLDLMVVKLYLEARYTWVFTEGSTSTYVPVSLGVTF